MKGSITVRPKQARVPTPAAVKTKADAQLAAGWAAAEQLLARTPPPNTIYAGLGNTVTLFGFVPEHVTVKAGTPLTVVGGSSTEPHNLGVGPEDYIKTLLADTDKFPETPDPAVPNQTSPLFIYGSDPGAITFNGSNHGNGFFSTPAVDNSPDTPLLSSAQVTFTNPGTYTVYCLIHFPDMKAEVVVTP
jgi:plastocyanin